MLAECHLSYLWLPGLTSNHMHNVLIAKLFLETFLGFRQSHFTWCKCSKNFPCTLICIQHWWITDVVIYDLTIISSMVCGTCLKRTMELSRKGEENWLKRCGCMWAYPVVGHMWCWVYLPWWLTWNQVRQGGPSLTGPPTTYCLIMFGKHEAVSSTSHVLHWLLSDGQAWVSMPLPASGVWWLCHMSQWLWLTAHPQTTHYIPTQYWGCWEGQFSSCHPSLLTCIYSIPGFYSGINHH